MVEATAQRGPKLALVVVVAVSAAWLSTDRPSGQIPVFGEWTELGPQIFNGLKPVSDGVVNGLERMSGQPAAIALDLTHDPSGNTVYVCSASGGVWKSMNALGTLPIFQNISDPRFPASCGAIALDTHTNPPSIYVGTGDPDNPSNIASYAGNGILISRDGGDTWTEVQSADEGGHPFKGMGFSRIIVDPGNPNVLLAATGVGSDGNYAHSAFPQENDAFDHLGIYRSTDAGNTWNRVRNAAIPDKNLGKFFHIDLIHEPVRDLYVAAISQHGLAASVSGNSWQPAGLLGVPTAGLPAAADMHRVSLATRNGALWALVLVNPCVNTGCELFKAHELFVLLPSATSWKKVLKPSGLPFKGFLGYVAAPPNSEGLVVGAEHLFRTDNIGAIIPAWHKIEYGSNASLHGDQHAIAFVNANTWYVGDDGGVFVTRNRGNDWRSLNTTLRTTEFYSATANSTDSGMYAGGQQDNGQAVSVDGVRWNQLLLGDGMYTAADPYDANGFFISSQFGGLWHVQVENGQPLSEKIVDFSDPSDPNVSGGRGAFLTPFEILPRDPRLFEGVTPPPGFDFNQARIVLTGTRNPWLIGYARGVAPLAVQLFNPVFPLNNPYIQYIASDPRDPTTAYFVTGDLIPRLYRLSNISFKGTASLTEVDAPGNQVLGHIAASPICSSGLYMAKVGFVENQKIYKTTTGGQTWVNISGNLPNVPVHWITVDRANPNVIYVGTNVGTFVATDGGVFGEQWRRLGSGLPNVPVMQLKISHTRQLIAATFGRGVWKLQLPTLLPYIPRPPAISNLTVTPATLWPPDNRMVDVLVNYTATDDCGIPACTLSATSSEPAGSDVDVEIVDAHHVRLRAQHAGGGSGRTYTITVTCSGNDGRTTSTTRTVAVQPGD